MSEESLIQALKEGKISFTELTRKISLTPNQKYKIFEELFGETIFKKLEQDVVVLMEKYVDKDLKHIDLADAINFIIGFHCF